MFSDPIIENRTGKCRRFVVDGISNKGGLRYDNNCIEPPTSVDHNAPEIRNNRLFATA